MSFFVWVGVLLFNIITGLIVDTFSAIREEADDRADVLENECFVCGLTRAKYDDIGPPSITFDQHSKEDHSLWSYLYFLSYLKRKDPTEYNGVESFVSQMLKAQDLSWVPSRTSFAIQNQAVNPLDQEDDLAAQVGVQIEDKVKDLARALHAVQDQLNTIQDSLSNKV